MPREDTMLQNTICSRIASRLMIVPVIVGLLSLSAPVSLARAGQSQASLPTDSATPPASTVKLIFIHHSTGENWLTDGNGDLGIALGSNNYFVSDTNYGWGPNAIGNNTDIPNWLEWFRSDDTPTYMAELYAESGQNSSYTRTLTDPGGANEIIMFKSCFPNSNLSGNPEDPPSAADDWYTVGHSKYVYNQLLLYFQQHPEKLFVVITAPPLSSSSTSSGNADNARAFNQWLVNDWLSQNSYTLKNVAVFDFYNVLTSNGGSSTVNDLNSVNGNHHRWWNEAVQHKTDGGTNFLAYPSGDDHPSRAGNLKATGEFVPMLNVFYNRWKTASNPTFRLTVNVVSDNATKGGGRIYNNGTTLIDCSNTGSNATLATGTCWADLAPGANMTLIQSPDGDSTPATWSGGACSGAGLCEVAAIAADTTITATFPYSSMAKVTSSETGYESLVSAYNYAAATDTIQARAVTFIEGSAGSAVTLNDSKTINLFGGLDAYYSATGGHTTIRNALEIRSGRLNVLGGIKIQ